MMSQPKRASLGLALVLLCSASCGADFAWPAPSLPADARMDSLGDDISINGMPSRIFTFSTSASADEAIATFRQQIERDFTRVPQRSSATDVTVGGRAGEFWLTLRLQPSARGTRGTWSAMPRYVPDVRRAVVRPTGFPGSATLLQQIDSFDLGKRSQQAFGLDPSPVDAVAQRMEEELREQGFTRQALPANHWPAPDRYVAIYSKAREEIWITLQQQRTGTAVSMNRISALESLDEESLQ